MTRPRRTSEHPCFSLRCLSSIRRRSHLRRTPWPSRYLPLRAKIRRLWKHFLSPRHALQVHQPMQPKPATNVPHHHAPYTSCGKTVAILASKPHQTVRAVFLHTAFLFCVPCLMPSSAPAVRTVTLSAQKRRVACLNFLTSAGRHRQTPATKHDQKTRHMGLAHIAQPSYLALSYFGEVFQQVRYAVVYVPRSFWDFSAPQIGAAVTG